MINFYWCYPSKKTEPSQAEPNKNKNKNENKQTNKTAKKAHNQTKNPIQTSNISDSSLCILGVHVWVGTRRVMFPDASLFPQMGKYTLDCMFLILWRGHSKPQCLLCGRRHSGAHQPRGRMEMHVYSKDACCPALQYIRLSKVACSRMVSGNQFSFVGFVFNTLGKIS